MIITFLGPFEIDIICKPGYTRHAKLQEPGNLVPKHFWRKIRTFSEIEDSLDHLSKDDFKLRESDLNDYQFYYMHNMKHPRVVSYNP